jgi:hypothetical protein
MGFKAAWKGLIQGTIVSEGGRDPLTPSITQSSTNTNAIDKNSYKTYSSKVKISYEMYNGRADYGSEIYGSVVDTRGAFISGEGISVTARKKSTQKYIDKFLELNNLHGSKLVNTTRIMEMEGKCLLLMNPKKKTVLTEEIEYIHVTPIQWWTRNYSVGVDEIDDRKLTKVAFKTNDGSGEKKVPTDKAAWIRTGGTNDRVNETPNKVHKILTDIENFSRMKYDLRKNHHLFAKIQQYFKTMNIQEAKAINKDINAGNFEIGQGYAGTADYSLVSVPLGALEALTGEMLLAAKIISMNTGIPIHWLAWPELMSNRATAENLLEVINAGTSKERLILQESLKELIIKSMIMAVDLGIEDNNIIGEFHLELPLVSLANLKAIQETWLPLQQMDVISMDTLRSKVPAINPSEEKKRVMQEKIENVEMFMDGKSEVDMRGERTKNLNNEGKDDTGEDKE